MGFRLANVHGRAALVVDNNYYDVEHVSGGAIGADPMAVLIDPSALSALSATLGDHAATGSLADVTLGAPVPRPRSLPPALWRARGSGPMRIGERGTRCSTRRPARRRP